MRLPLRAKEEGMRFSILTLGLVALAVLVAAGV